MGNTDGGFVDLFNLDHTKYQTDEQPGGPEEVVQEGEGGVDVVNQEGVNPEDIDLTPETEKIPPQEEGGDATGEDDPEKDVVEKQDAESEESTEDASTNQDPQDEPESPQEEPADDGAENVSEIGGVMQELVGDGTLTFDEEKEYEPSMGGLRELISETNAKAATEAVSEFKEKLGDDGKQLLDILDKGGSVNDFVTMNQQVDFSKVPIQDKDGNDLVQNQAYLVEDWLKIQGYEANEIDEKVRELHEAGLLGKEATRSQKKLADWQTKKNEELIATREAEKEAKEAERIEMEATFKENVLGTREIAGFKISKSQAEKLYNYVVNPVGPNGESQFALDDNEESRMLYAYFAMSGFDKEKLSKEIATKQALNLKKGLSNFKDSNAKPKGTGQSVKKETGEGPKINWAFTGK